MSLLGPQLDAFTAIVKHKTVHAAAHTLYVTQTAVTQRIRALEKKLSTTLFIRTRRGMQLTHEGEALWRYCQATQTLENEAIAKIQGCGVMTEARISMAGPTSIMTARIIPQCLKIMSDFPQLLIDFNITNTERGKALQAGQTDLAILQVEHLAPEMNKKILKPEDYVLVCSTKWKNRKLNDIIQTEKIIDFNADDHMTINYLKKYHLFELSSLSRHFVNCTETIAKMTIQGFGYSVLTIEFSKPYIKNKKLIILNHGKIYKNEMALAWYARHESPKYFSALIDSIN